MDSITYKNKTYVFCGCSQCYGDIEVTNLDGIEERYIIMETYNDFSPNENNIGLMRDVYAWNLMLIVKDLNKLVSQGVFVKNDLILFEKIFL